MWDKVGIIRDAAGLAEAERDLAALDAELERCSLPDANRAFDLTWHDWLNLRSLVAVSRVIAAAAIARTDSRGAHFRSDFPDTGALKQSAFTSIQSGRLTMKPVSFTRVRPGESLLKNAA
jgi:fumarate reductase flavoprotein subunit